MKVLFKVIEANIRESGIYLPLEKKGVFLILSSLMKTWFETYTHEGKFGEILDCREEYCYYSTCRHNVWETYIENGEVFLRYSGSRHGFFSFTPFHGMGILTFSGDFMTFLTPIPILIKDVFYEIRSEDGKIVANVLNEIFDNCVEKSGERTLILCGEYQIMLEIIFKLIEYKTSTPKNWEVKYYELVVAGDKLLEEQKKEVEKKIGRELTHSDAVILTPYKPVETGAGYSHIFNCFKPTRVFLGGYKV